MTDIVERLRVILREYDEVGWHADVAEAADTIERLRGALKKIAAMKYDHQEMNDIAFAAIKDIVWAGKE